MGKITIISAIHNEKFIKSTVHIILFTMCNPIIRRNFAPENREA